jgi:zinc/manganese transport system permease protein
MLDIFGHEFVQNAFLAGTIVALVSGLVGYYVILRGQAFTCESLSHVGFAGAAGAALIGASSLVGMFVFTILAAIGMAALGRRLPRRDVEIGMLLSFVLGLGVLFLSIYTHNANAAVGVLFGSILSVTRADVLITLGSGLATIAILAYLFRPLLFASIDAAAAEARGIPVGWLSLLFLVLLAVTISEAVQVVGVLLVFALLVVPAAAAEHVTHSPLSGLALSVALSLISTWGGLVLAFVGHWPVSFYIVAITSLFYGLSRVFQHLSSPRRYTALPHPSREVVPPAR